MRASSQRIGRPGEGEVHRSLAHDRAHSRRTNHPGRRRRRRHRRRVGVDVGRDGRSRPTATGPTRRAPVPRPDGTSALARPARAGRMNPENRSSRPSEIGSTWLRSASVDHSVGQLAQPVRLVVGPVQSLRRSPPSRSKSSQRSSAKSRLPTASSSSSRTPVLMWFVVAFHPSW